MANTVPLFYEHYVERRLLGVTVPAAALQSISPVFTLAILPVLSNRWERQARAGDEQSAASKLTLGIALAASGWLVMAASASEATSECKSSLVGPLVANVLYTLGHVHVGPVGLSLVTACAPPAAQSSAVGIWMLFGGLGGIAGGPLGSGYSVTTPDQFFTRLAAIAAACSVSVWVLVPRLERVARGVGP